MIASLRSRLAGGANIAILLREAARTSRRWQTYASRTGFSGALFAVLLLGIYAFMSAGTDPADMGWMGRWIFIVFSTVLLLLASTLAPLMTSAAMIEEIEDRTLEMLILSELTPARILVGKVLSRILQLLTVVMGALPVLAMVVTLGGVAPHQVVAVVVHTLVAVVLMGVLGAFFGLFTRSPALAMLASVSFGFVAFLVFPGGYVLFTAEPSHAAHFSLVAGPATTDWAALLSVLSYLPSLGVMAVIGTRLFELQVSQADLKHAFSAETWGTRRFFLAGALALAALVLVVPSSFVLYTLQISNAASTLAVVTRVVAAGVVWLWATGVMALVSWVLLRVGVDIVDALDAILGGRDERARAREEVHVWTNPVAWREARPAAWSANGLPLLVSWLLILLGMLQTGWWMIPGGAVMIGVLNTLAGMGLTVWLVTRSVDEERRRDSFLVLLTTPMAAWRILAGKLLGVAVITFPLLFLSLPFFVFGVPYLEALGEGSLGGAAQGFVIGALTWLWTIPVWGVLLTGCLLVSLGVKRSRSGFAVATGVLGALLGLPTLFGRLFDDVGVLAVPSQLVAPPLAGGAAPWMYVVSSGLWTLGAIGLLVVAVRGLRTWILASW
jgi:ABC-type transport system involved in multi-copper enzyme maturation permease subunit